MSKTTITAVGAREILDSRGNPTLLVTVTCEGGAGSFGVPSGASTGTGEAAELPVPKAIANVQDALAHVVVGMDVRDQHALDHVMIELDGTPNKSRLGGNAIIGISIAVAKAAATCDGALLHEYLKELAPNIKPSSTGRRTPYLAMNLINGGKHAIGRLAFQEYKIVPQTDDIAEALHIGTTIMHGAQKAIAAHYGPSSANIGDEGGFAPNMDSVRKPLELLMDVAEHAGMAEQIKLAMDVAASSFYSPETGLYEYDNGQHSADELSGLLRTTIRDYPLLYIEDPFNEDKFEDFAELNDGSTIIVGDDLTVTNASMLKKALKAKAIGGIIIKPNQVGTLTETLECMELARKKNIECVVSHRSGETNDDFIADLAVAFGVFAIKAGAPQRGERVAKYNRLLEIFSTE